MATGGQGSNTDEDNTVNKLTCAICLEKYRRPKVLPCFHSFCQVCLQGVAGSSPSLSCPSCRAFVLLPPGGVKALQTNFYIEDDVSSSASSPQRRLCDVCEDDREATHTCLQCQQKFCLPCRKYHDGFRLSFGHTVVSLTQEDTEGCEQGAVPAVEMCPKHRDQRLLLHCNKCQADICIQCKLTQHDGHPTEDLVDTRAKAKTSVEEALKSVTQQRHQVQHLILAFNDRRAKLLDQQQDTERGFEDRADTLHHWVNLSRDEAVKSVQLTAKELDKPLQEHVEQLQNRDSALHAQQEYMVRVLNDGKEADIVALEAQLKSTLLESLDLKQVEKELTTNFPKLHVKHSTSVGHQQLREFVGVLQPVQPPSSPQQSGSVAGSASSAGSTAAMQIFVKMESPRKLIYSKNPQSSVIAMCPISQGRLWVMYKPSPNATILMKLFDADGQVLATMNNVQACSGLVTITDDNVLAWVYHKALIQMISPDGELSSHNLELDIGRLVSCATNDRQYIRVINDGRLFHVKFSVSDKLVCSKGNFFCEVPRAEPYPCHVSSTGEYIVLVVDGTVKVFTTKQSSVLFSSYTPGNSRALDACFCQFGGKELLAVVVFGDNNVYIIDHTDGGVCERSFNTDTSLNRHFMDPGWPRLLATDFDQHLWIGCTEGRFVMFDL
ncbi:uncharacterized protein LOC143299093 [Babylonia areolata]|uniref:uncharacterized protein LOC143299093 n=1 Tax=Babylonia areolata TaxID=304850 RepID=UPI003FD04327